ncbi:MAG: hypothetical protein JO326_12170 [Acetobacteraceae bacterium]|nr:hypothetical protein [Acetobacteraceae bacterium]
MLATLSLIGLVSGGGLACAAARRPTSSAVLERWGGTLLVTGLALLGAGLPTLY